MSIVKLPQLAWYGTRELELSFPDSWQVKVYNMAGWDRPAMKPEEIKSALTDLIGSPPIREIAKGKNEVVIIFDDMTRVTRVADIVPFILEELAEAGVPDNKIRFICATGAHMAWDRTWLERKLGRAVLARFPVYNHNPFDNCTYVGTTSYGNDIYINAEVMKCDLKIGIGSVVPHSDTGFGGGSKIIVPGVACMKTIDYFHRLEFEENNAGKPITGMGVVDDNPLRLNVEEAAALAGLDVKVDCIVNARGETVAIFAGAPKPTFEAAVREGKAHYLMPQIKGTDIVIASTFAKANEAIFAGLTPAFAAVSHKGGDIVLIANAPDGQVAHYLFGMWGNAIRGAIRFQITLPTHVNHIIIFSEYPDIASMKYFEEPDKVLLMDRWDSILQLLHELHGANARVAVYPNPEIQYWSG